MKSLQTTLLLLVGTLLLMLPGGYAQDRLPGPHSLISGSYVAHANPFSEDTVEVTGEANLLTAKFIGIPDELVVGETATIEVQAEVKRLLWNVPKDRVVYAAGINLNAPFIPTPAYQGATNLEEAEGRGKYKGSVDYYCEKAGEGKFAGTVVVDLPDGAGFRDMLEATVDESVECVEEEESESHTLRVLKEGKGKVTGKLIYTNEQILVCGPECVKDFPLDYPIRLIAKPAAGFFFAGWSGETSSGKGCEKSPPKGGTCEFAMTHKDRTVTAAFKRKQTEGSGDDEPGTGQIPGEPIGFGETRTMNFSRSDAAPSKKGTGFVEAGFDYNSFEFENIYDINLRGEYAFCDNFAAGAEIGYRTFSFEDDMLDSRSGLKDPEISAWKGFRVSDALNTAVGGMVKIPAGNEEEVNQGNFDYGVFGTVRYQMSDNLIGVGQINLNSYEPDFEEEDREFVPGAKGSLMYQLSDNITAFGEFSFQGETEFAFRPAQYDYGKIGVGYHTPMSFDFRAAVGAGFDEEQAADYKIEFKIGKNFSF